jgi:hypothetical protein
VSEIRSEFAMRRLTRISSLLAAALFLVWSVLELLMGSPPADGAEILDWLLARQTLLAFVSETLFFGAMFLVPASFGIYRWLTRDHAWAAIFSAGSVFVAIPLLLVSLIAHGRLVYPIFHIKVHTREIAELTLAFYYGGLHAFSLIMAGAAFVVSFATRQRRRALSVFGLVTVVCDLMAGYPDALGPNLTFGARLPFAVWLVVVGLVASRDSADREA